MYYDIRGRWVMRFKKWYKNSHHQTLQLHELLGNPFENNQDYVERLIQVCLNVTETYKGCRLPTTVGELHKEFEYAGNFAF